MTPSFKAVIFDFDYTLADSSEGVVECVNYALRGVGLPEANARAQRPVLNLVRHIYSEECSRWTLTET